MGEYSELSGLVLKIAEALARQKEELELTRADLEVLAHSAVTNVKGIKDRLERAEEAITTDQPKAISERFDRVEARLEEIFARLSQINSKVAGLEARLEDRRSEEKEELKYNSAIRILAGTGKLNPEILRNLE